MYLKLSYYLEDNTSLRAFTLDHAHLDVLFFTGLQINSSRLYPKNPTLSLHSKNKHIPLQCHIRWFIFCKSQNPRIVEFLCFLKAWSNPISFQCHVSELILSFIKYLFGTPYVPGTLLGCVGYSAALIILQNF